MDKPQAMTDSSAFAPFASLAASLLAEIAPTDDGSHDSAHLRRVWVNARAILAGESAHAEIVAAAVLLHDCVAVEKSSPLRAQASRLAAERARDLLAGLGWDRARIDAVAHAVAAHSFSAGIVPETIEARIVQDADRLDAIGSIGVARCFYTAGRMGSALYHADDPRAVARPLDDARYALDHFRAKLLGLHEDFQTATGARLAAERARRIAGFLNDFEQEIGAP